MSEERFVTIICKPVRVRVGDYFPAEFEITNATVAVDVPLVQENFHNFEYLDRGVDETPALTTKGFRWCYNQLRDALKPDLADEEPDSEEPDSEEPDNDELDKVRGDLEDEEWT